MKMKELWIWISIIAVALITLWGLIALVDSSSTSSTSQIGTPKAVSDQDITLGNIDKAKVILIEYADFQCPACSISASFVRKLNKEFGNSLLIVYRFFPLTNIHQNSMPSAQAAFAAHKQDKFWEMSELLYQNQDLWAEDQNAQKIFTDYAKKINLNIDQFTKDYNADSTKKFINAEGDEGLSIGINSTPSFFVNGKLIQNPQDYEAFKQIIQNEINNK
jgi:protein-disulfide isomerase